MRKLILLSLVALAAVSWLMQVDAEERLLSGYDVAVDRSGNIQVPDVNFHLEWAMLGTWVVNGDDDSANAMHVVYTQPGVAESFRATGKFPDGAVLIKELLSTETSDYTTGRVSRAKNVTGRFVMVKDTKGRFKRNKIWGDGWGWAYFDKTERKISKTTDYKAECLACHVPAKNNDWVYVEGYPALGKK